MAYGIFAAKINGRCGFIQLELFVFNEPRKKSLVRIQQKLCFMIFSHPGFHFRFQFAYFERLCIGGIRLVVIIVFQSGDSQGFVLRKSGSKRSVTVFFLFKRIFASLNVILQVLQLFFLFLQRIFFFLHSFPERLHPRFAEFIKFLQFGKAFVNPHNFRISLFHPGFCFIANVSVSLFFLFQVLFPFLQLFNFINDLDKILVNQSGVLRNRLRSEILPLVSGFNFRQYIAKRDLCFCEMT